MVKEEKDKKQRNQQKYAHLTVNGIRLNHSRTGEELTKSPNRLRVPITMPEEMFSYLTRASVKSKITGGKKLSMTEMINAMVAICLLENNVDVSGVKDEEELVERISEVFKKI